MKNYYVRTIVLSMAVGFAWLCAGYTTAAAVNNIVAGVEREYPSLERLYHHLHSHPELSLQEEKTSARIAQELRAAGFDVTENVGGYGVVGIMRNGEGPTVMVRTDMDALPIKEETGLPYASRVEAQNNQGRTVGVMHACGHDVHMTVFTGVAQLMSRERDQWRGVLLMIGQPAEEVGLGAKAMLADGLFERFPRPDYMLGLHIMPDLPTGTVGYAEGYAMASVDEVYITVRGVGGHGARPHKTKDPVVIAAQIILGLQTIVSREILALEPAVVTVGQIHGGTKCNIIPDEVKMDLTVRTYSEQVREHILSAIKRISEGIAMAAGVGKDRLPIVYVRDNPCPSLYNSPELVKRVNKSIAGIIGSENITAVAPKMGGEDFAHYRYQNPSIPSYYFFIGATAPAQIEQSQKTKTPLPGLHTSRVAPVAEPTIKTGIKAMTAAVLDLMRPKED